MRWSRESGDLLFSLKMTTFAMVVETPPLYKDLRDLGCKSWVSFFAVFVCILSETKV